MYVCEILLYVILIDISPISNIYVCTNAIP